MTSSDLAGWIGAALTAVVLALAIRAELRTRREGSDRVADHDQTLQLYIDHAREVSRLFEKELGAALERESMFRAGSFWSEANPVFGHMKRLGIPSSATGVTRMAIGDLLDACEPGNVSAFTPTDSPTFVNAWPSRVADAIQAVAAQKIGKP